MKNLNTPRINKRRTPFPKQIIASITNGAKSKGPVTEAGKRNSRANLTPIRQATPRSSLRIHRPCEPNPNLASSTVASSVCEYFNPATPLEEILVGRLIASHWRQLRYMTIEALDEPFPGPSKDHMAQEMRSRPPVFPHFRRPSQPPQLPSRFRHRDKK
jgi:hypothetical protein